MFESLDRLKNEWTTIKAAPYSFLIACIAIGVIAVGSIHFFYQESLDKAKELASHWQGEAAYWRELSEHSKNTKSINTKPTIDPKTSQTRVKPSLDAKKAVFQPGMGNPQARSENPLQTTVNNAPGGFAVSGGSLDHPTVNNYGPIPRRLSDDQKKVLDKLFCELPQYDLSHFSATALSNVQDAGSFMEQIENELIKCKRGLSATTLLEIFGDQPVGVSIVYGKPIGFSQFLFASKLNQALNTAKVSSSLIEDPNLGAEEVHLMVGTQ